MAAKIRKGDRVVVLTGKDKGQRGDVLRMFPSENRALVQGVNIVRRHQRQTPQSEGGIISKEMPIHLSNLALEDPESGKPTRVQDTGRRPQSACRKGFGRSDRWLRFRADRAC
jgi:large subunit ribosomal protein L24